MCEYSRKLAEYRQTNSYIRYNGVVFFGGRYFADLPVNELAQLFGLGVPLYNRSLEGLRLDQAEEVLGPCVLDLHPDKLFLNLGEADCTPGADAEALTEAYRQLLEALRRRCSARICITSVMSSAPEARQFNASLKKLAQETGCTYVDTLRALEYDKPEIKLFELLHVYLRSRKIGFAEAMNMPVCQRVHPAAG